MFPGARAVKKVLKLAAALAVAVCVSSSPAHADTAEKKPRERFVVAPFVNGNGWRALDYLQAGLPAIVAERLSRHPSLSLAGGTALVAADRGSVDELVARAGAGGIPWVVTGRFERQPNWSIQVAVEVWPAGELVSRGPAGRGVVVGTKDEVDVSAVAAALDAFAAAGRAAPAAMRPALTAKFSRDPYAFVLYGRAVAAFVGLDGKPASGDRAIESLRRSIVVDPKVPESRRYLGMVHLSAGNPGHARAFWSMAVDLRPDYIPALLGLAALDRAAGLPTARERYARVVELAPDELDARRAYGEILGEAGSLEEAQVELRKVLAVAPGDVRARRALVLVLASRHAGAELVTELSDLVRLDPDDVDARFELAAAQSSVGKVDGALATYEEILKRRPRNAPALKLAADLYLSKGDTAKAAARYEKLRRVAPDDPRPVFLLGAAYYQAGRLDQAERLFTDGAQYPGMLGDAYSNLGAIAFRKGQLRQALWFLQRAAKRRPGKAGVRYNYAVALNAAERHQEALDELKAAAAADAQDAGVRFLAGVIALRLGRLGDAQQGFRDALRLDPAMDDARFNLALLDNLIAPSSELGINFADSRSAKSLAGLPLATDRSAQ